MYQVLQSNINYNHFYASLYSYVAPFSEDFIYFPCESLYGNIEVKSKWNKKSLIDATENIRSLKKSQRKELDTFYSNAMTPLRINNIKWNIETTNEYLGVIFV